VAAPAPSDRTAPIPALANDRTSLLAGLSADPSLPGDRPQRPRGSRWGLGGAVIAALAVLAVIAVLAVSRIGDHHTAGAWPGTGAVVSPAGSGSRSSTPPASTSGPVPSKAAGRRGRAQAAVIAGYLTRSGQARHRIGTAISAINDCTHIASAVSALHHAADVRAHIAAALADADVAALRHGAAAVADLGRAMRASASADRHYAAWGRASAGCHQHPRHDSEFAAAQRSDTAATAAKRRFVHEWNPIADRYGLAEQNANTI
jgi:hypothetical protein